MYSIVSTAAVHGIKSILVQVEADVCDGLPSFEMVGVLSSEVKEARERIRSAIRNTGIRLAPKRVTVNLCPADIRKSGTGFDLPIALAVLAAYGCLDNRKMSNILFAGEVTLNGGLRPVDGILPMALMAKENGMKAILVPGQNAKEASCVFGLPVYSAESLGEVADWLDGRKKLEMGSINIEETGVSQPPEVDFREIKGQPMLRRACEVAAAGRHNMLMVGPPGAGKTMAAKAIPGILPPLDEGEAMELAGIYSVCGRFEERRRDMQKRPFRCPHHSVTRTALVGGGREPRPGEISLAHDGVLFLDELTEYAKPVLELLRQPLEEHSIRLVRVSGTFLYPADFMMVAAMNPCSCGYYPDREKCGCSPAVIKQHLQKVSRPLLDRIDLCVAAPRLNLEELMHSREHEDSGVIRRRVEAVHHIQRTRYEKEAVRYNSRIPAGSLQKYCPMESEARKSIQNAYERLNLSARSYHRIIRVARTIADLDAAPRILEEHMEEALLYRSMDEKLWR